jgi:hypothetical protein
MPVNFTSLLQNLAPEVIPSQEFCLNLSPILNNFGARDIWKSEYENRKVLGEKVQF